MKTYKVKLQFTTDYLQARFTEDAKKELENYISKGIIKTADDSWKVFIYEDDNGIYIPNIQIRNCLVNAGKEFKVKKQRRSMMQWCVSNIIVSPERIYLGKKNPDKVITSYPARKDGQRVTLKHPCINSGTQVQFDLKILDGEMEEKAIRNLIVTAGKMYGIGSRRKDMYGRFDLVSLN